MLGSLSGENCTKKCYGPYLAANVEQQVPFAYFVNLEQVMAALRRIARDGKHILPTHDPEVYTRYPAGIE